MQKSFGTLKGIPVYKVERFDNELKNQGFIQVVDDGDRYWKICTMSKIADGVYDSFAGNTTIYDEREFNKSIEQLLRIASTMNVEVKPTPVYNSTEGCLLPELDTIIDEIMGSVGTACNDLLDWVEQRIPKQQNRDKIL